MMILLKNRCCLFLASGTQKVGTSWPTPNASLLRQRTLLIGDQWIASWKHKNCTCNKASTSFHLALPDSDYVFFVFLTVSMPTTSRNNIKTNFPLVLFGLILHRPFLLFIMLLTMLQWLIGRRVLSAIALLSFKFVTCEQKCYDSIGGLDERYTPCNLFNGDSHCCRPGFTCLSNGLCAPNPRPGQRHYLTPYYTSLCTNDIWDSDMCPRICNNADPGAYSPSPHLGLKNVN